MQAPKFSSFKSQKKAKDGAPHSSVVNHEPSADRADANTAPFAYTVRTSQPIKPEAGIPRKNLFTRNDDRRKRARDERAERKPRERSRSPRLERLPLPVSQSDYTVDLVGDWQNAKFGRNGKVPAYRRRASRVLGLASQFGVEPLELPEVGQTPSTAQVGYLLNDPSRPRFNLLLLPEPDRRIAKQASRADIAAALGDYIALSSKQPSETLEKPASRRLAFMLDPKIVQASDSDGDDAGFESDEEMLTSFMAAEQAALSNLVKDNPADEIAWLALARIQDQIVKQARQDGSGVARQGAAKVKVPILEKAMIPNPHSTRLSLAYMEAFSLVSDKHAIQAAWLKILSRIPNSLELWTRYLDHLILRFHDQYHTLLDEHKAALQVTRAYWIETSDNYAHPIMAEIFESLLNLYMRFGYVELAVAHVQVFAKLMGDQLVTLDAIKSWWDEEGPRPGENIIDADRASNECTERRSDCCPDESLLRTSESVAAGTRVQELLVEPMENFVAVEQASLALRAPLRVDDQSQAENDLYAVVLSDDLNLVSFREANPIVKSQLLFNCLSRLGFDSGLQVDRLLPSAACNLFALILDSRRRDACLKAPILAVSLAFYLSRLTDLPMTYEDRQQFNISVAAHVATYNGTRAAQECIEYHIERKADDCLLLWVASALLQVAPDEIEPVCAVFEQASEKLKASDLALPRFPLRRFVLRASYAFHMFQHASPVQALDICNSLDVLQARQFLATSFDAPQWSRVLLSLTAVDGVRALASQNGRLDDFLECYDEARTRASLNYRLRSRLVEQLYQQQIEQLTRASEGQRIRPSIFRDLLYEAVLSCPHNALFCNLFAQHEVRFKIQMRIWKLQGEVLQACGRPSLAIMLNMAALEERPNDPDAMVARINTLERLLSLNEDVSIEIREHFSFELLSLRDKTGTYSSVQIKRLFFEATWQATSKRLLLMPFFQLRKHFEISELKEVYELMLKRGIRLVGDLDDFFEDFEESPVAMTSRDARTCKLHNLTHCKTCDSARY